MTSIHFLQSRERGNVGQHYVAELLRAQGYPLDEVEDGYFPDYDIRLSTGTTIEVKTDFRAKDTGNFCLELEALCHSRADILAIVIDKTVYLAPLQPVITLADKWPRKVRGGEFGLEMALVPINEFVSRINPTILHGH